ncbi:uncharacterized protein BJ171DRAFT_565222 [Polychytrium aggregatum]|uniref:uncharacterized protein n=1 Tax=Polychytrium aggregatum TaxID=110093 RepID=UPI0022FED7C7|nr:uncharacterized protein BJ171DRAFT_565222 [Polychytrium aggregatum]KAI9208768.1 hypothetical protein BJ171DRAFT_565222 [Polychytrium aggregatum]
MTTGAGSPHALDVISPSDNRCPDIFTVVCFNHSFQSALDYATIKALLYVCRRAQPLLSSKMSRLHDWCQTTDLRRPDGSLRIRLTPADQIALSLHCDDQATLDRSWLVALAEQKNASASYLLAQIMQHEIDQEVQVEDGSERRRARYQQLFQHLENAVRSGHRIAQFHLAGCYHDGTGVDQDRTKAVELYRDLAESGLPQAQVGLGRCYEGGEGVDRDFNTAIEWYTKAADQGCDDGQLDIAFLRGWFSLIGHGVEQSDETAFHLWQEVSTQSNSPVHKPIATHMVGWMLYLGRGTQQDKQRGIAIIRDNKSDEFPLGEDNGLACGWNYTLKSSDSPASRTFFELCQLGSDRDWLCKHLKAVCLINRFGAQVESGQAASIFEQLSNDGHSDSQLWIGDLYSSGGGESEAFEWYSKSANKGNSYGEWMVGFCYYDGIGVAQDYVKAAEWFRKSAEQGNRYGQYWLANCYEYGEGVAKDIDTAIVWCRRAAEQGEQDAAVNLGFLCRSS